MFFCAAVVSLSGTQKREAAGGLAAMGRLGAGWWGGVVDKPNYLLRIQRKCLVNCGDPEEGWRFSEAGGGGGGGQVGNAVYHF